MFSVFPPGRGGVVVQTRSEIPPHLPLAKTGVLGSRRRVLFYCVNIPSKEHFDFMNSRYQLAGLQKYGTNLHQTFHLRKHSVNTETFQNLMSSPQLRSLEPTFRTFTRLQNSLKSVNCSQSMSSAESSLPVVC